LGFRRPALPPTARRRRNVLIIHSNSRPARRPFVDDSAPPQARVLNEILNPDSQVPAYHTL
jgi:hypothetical protein